MKQRILSIVGLTVMLVSLFVIFNYSLAASQTPIDAGNGGGGGEPGGTITPIEPEPAKPDLTVKYLLDRYQNRDNIQIDKVNNYSVVVNKPITVEAIIANKGTGTSGATSVDIYIDNVFKKRLAAHGIIGGGTGSEDEFYTWTPKLATHKLKIVVDPLNTVAESDETNNTYEIDLVTVAEESQIRRTLDLLPYEGFNPNTNYFVHVKSIEPGDANGTLGSATFEVSPQNSNDVVATLGPVVVGSGVHYLTQYGFGLEVYYVGTTYNGNSTDASPVAGIRWSTVSAARNEQQIVYQGDRVDLTDEKSLRVKRIEPCDATCVWPAGFSFVQFEVLDSAGNVVYTTDDLYPGSQTYYFDQYHFAIRISGIGTAQDDRGPSAAMYLETTDTAHDLVILPYSVEVYNLTTSTAQVVWVSNKPSSYTVFFRQAKGTEAYQSLAPTTWFQTFHEFILDNLKAATKYNYYIVAVDEVSHAQVTSPIYTFTTKSMGVGIAPVKPQPTEVPHADDTPPVVYPGPVSNPSSPAETLHKHIRDLQIPVTEVESKVVAQEKQLSRSADAGLTNRLKGKILLQVENKGEAWYIDPVTNERFYLQNGDSAYQALRAFGLGISTVDLNKIPVAPVTDATMSGTDTDHDGLSDSQEASLGTDPNNVDSDNDSYSDGMEVSNGFDPLGANKIASDTKLVDRLKGRIVLQTDAHGEAWYINPADGKRYFLGDGEQAYKLMRYLSLGIKNDDLRKITVGDLGSGQ